MAAIEPALDIERLPPITDHTMLTERVEQALRTAILDGRLAPGTRLSVPEVARTLNVSRTPAREALFGLERDGLVHLFPRRGAVVVQGTARDLRELLELREAVDGMGARLAAGRASAGQQARLRRLLADHLEALRADDMDDYLRIDLEFHLLVVEAAGNERLARTAAQIRDQVHVVMRTGAGLAERIGRAVMSDHRAIWEAVAAGDPDGAEDAARAHVRRVRDHVIPRLPRTVVEQASDDDVDLGPGRGTSSADTGRGG